MTAPIPTTEPTELRAGLSWQWQKSLGDYPAPTWVLRYWLKNAGSHIEIAAAASGSDHLVTVLASATQNYAPGQYAWTSTVESGAIVLQAAAGKLTLLPRVDQAQALDSRSVARRIVDELEAAKLAYVQSTQQGASMVQSYSIADRSTVFRTEKDFIEQIEYWRNQLAAEDAAEAIAQGQGNPRKYFASFR